MRDVRTMKYVYNTKYACITFHTFSFLGGYSGPAPTHPNHPPWEPRPFTYRTVLISPCYANFFDPLAVCREQLNNQVTRASRSSLAIKKFLSMKQAGKASRAVPEGDKQLEGPLWGKRTPREGRFQSLHISHAHARTRTRTHTHTHTQTNTHTHAHKYITHARTHVHNARTHVRARTHTYAHAHKQTRT